MRRHSNVAVRHDWERRIVEQGLVYSPTPTPDGRIMQYWREGAAYSFTSAEIDALAGVSSTLFEMCIAAGDHMVAHPKVMRRMGIPDWAHAAVERSWNRTVGYAEVGSVYARFDLRFGGLDHADPSMRIPKLYEFNADTPTCLVESAWIQWQWLHDTAFGPDQWNMVWENLIPAWQRNLGLIAQELGHEPTVYFACTDDEPSGEDMINTLYLRDSCAAAGYRTESVFMEDIMLGTDGMFYTRDGSRHLDVVFKLYPWEWMLEQEFGRACVADMFREPRFSAQGTLAHGTWWVEPLYKTLWSNKGLLVVLWELYGDDPERSKYLIPAWFEGDQPRSVKEYVRKPLLGREGANVTIVRDGATVEEHPGYYGAEGFVVQEFAPLPGFDAEDSDGPVHPMCGVWMVDGDPSGLAVRESTTLVTDNLSNFVPHVISDAPDRKSPVEPTGVIHSPDWSAGWPTLGEDHR